ncbi:MAG: peptidase E [Polaromonas sp.]|nr:peptidase E [Polaromonas sp.]
MTPRVIAIGGGGFTHEADSTMEDFILAQVPMVRPRIGFIGAASRDDPVKIARFNERFSGACASCTHLPSTAGATEAQVWVAALDIVYVGGGNTLHLVSHWRTQGIDQVMMAAARRGVLMAGVSAGANVWFDHALSDSGGNGLTPTAGIGLIPGSCCPHYSSESQRQPAYMACIARGELPDGVAIDDGVAVLFEGTGARVAHSSRDGAGACIVRRVGNALVCEPVAPAIRP